MINSRGDKKAPLIEAEARLLLDKSMRLYAGNGEPIPDGVLDAHRKDLKNRGGISGARFNELMFASMKRLGDEGNYAIYDTLKRLKPDGTPGMYNIPEWKQRIDAAQIYAQSVYLTKRTIADAALMKERERATWV